MTAAAHPAGDRRHIPEAWPRLLSRDQLCAYVGLGWATLSRVLTVSPRDLGANVLLYDRLEVDGWVDSLPARLPKPVSRPQDAAADPLPEPPPIEDLRPAAESAIERARARAAKGRTRWRKTD